MSFRRHVEEGTGCRGESLYRLCLKASVGPCQHPCSTAEQPGWSPMGTDGDPGAVLPCGVNAGGDALAAVHENLHHAAVHKNLETERIAGFQLDRCCFRRAGKRFGVQRCARAVDRDRAVRCDGAADEITSRGSRAMQKENPGGFFSSRRAQHAYLQQVHSGEVEFEIEFECAAPDRIEDDVSVGWKGLWLNGYGLAAEWRCVGCRLDAESIPSGQRQSAGQCHELVASFVRLCRLHVEKGDDPPSAVGRGGRGMDASGHHRAEVERPSMGHNELLSSRVVVAKQILGTPNVGKVEQEVSVAEGPEVGTAPVVTNPPEGIVFNKWVQVAPLDEIGGRVQEKGTLGRAAGAVWQASASESKILPVVTPDARIKDRERRGWIFGLWHRDDRVLPEFGPVQEQGIAGGGDHRARLGAVIDGDDPIGLHERCPGITAALRAGMDGVWQVAPVEEVVAYGMSPVLPGVFGRKRLVEQVPAPLPIAQAVGVVESALRAGKMIRGPEGSASQCPARF